MCESTVALCNTLVATDNMRKKVKYKLAHSLVTMEKWNSVNHKSERYDIASHESAAFGFHSQKKLFILCVCDYKDMLEEQKKQSSEARVCV